MTSILLLVFFIFAIIGLVKIFSPKKTINNNNLNYKTKTVNTIKENTINNNNDFLKKTDIYLYDLKGIFYNNYKKVGNFIGVAKSTYSQHDKYAVGIFINNTLAGYTPKGNFRLFNSITSRHNNNVFCWGNIGYDNYQNAYFGSVCIPIGFSEEEINNLKDAINLIPHQEKLFIKENKSTSEYLELLENDKKFYSLIKNTKALNNINYQLHRGMIPQFSKKLETEKDWENLIKLEKYSKEINDLSDKFKNTTLRRIELAKTKITSNTQTD